MNRTEFLDSYSEVMSKAAITVENKNDDYSSKGDPEEDAFGNLSLCESLSKGKISREMGVLIRLSDKLARVFNLIDDDEPSVKDEDVGETLEDIINYAAIISVMVKDRRENVSRNDMDTPQSEITRETRKNKISKSHFNSKKAR